MIAVDKDRIGGVSPVLRYPGGKQRLLAFLTAFLPARDEISGRYVEPFFGGGAVFFHIRPRRAIVSDSNAELIDLYRGVRRDPMGVWERYEAFGETKEDYHCARNLDLPQLDLVGRAARLLYLSRTCFKGNWRHNSQGRFNVGYGGQSRRWVIDEDCLLQVARTLRRVRILCSDFEPVIDRCGEGDYLFLDPPYHFAKRDLINDHYAWRQFRFSDHERLAAALRRCAARGAAWSLTTSAHPDVVALFRGHEMHRIPDRGQGVGASGGVLILSHGGNK